MTYTKEQIAAHIDHRANCIGEDSKDVRILRQLLAECDAANAKWKPSRDAMVAELESKLDVEKDAVLREAADAMQPSLRSMISRGQARSMILSLTKDNNHE